MKKILYAEDDGDMQDRKPFDIYDVIDVVNEYYREPEAF